ncbi:zinc finger BED domain-containing protein 1-like [Astatotilapia calliptera]|uniref:zinc finger BED domain-containing protein 1-like n=1 Tax=Astatotilapia calliptera TaxID=8154 RepID=UPI000E42AF84|nr:zinc finger BED domain-containing protein 1-like [Astatotilapia calliptera]
MDEGGLLGGKFLFKKLPDGLLDKTRVRCTICNAEFKYHRSSSSLAYHLRAKHPTESTSTGPRQSTLQEYGACGRITKNVREKVTNSLVVWIAKNCRPVSIVEDDGLREVIRAASGDECYNLPSRGTIVSRLHTLYGDQRAQQSSKLVQVRNVALTGDHWTSVNNDNYLGVMAHFIDNDWTMQSFALTVSKTEERHYAEACADHFLNVANEWKSPANAQELKAQEAAHGHQTEPLVQDVPTRWNSTLEMIKRIQRNKFGLTTILTQQNSKVTMLTDQELDRLQKLEELLEPCRYVTELLGGERYVSCSMVLPALCHLFRIMEPSDDDPVYVLRFKKIFTTDLAQRRDSSNLTWLKIATALDPRFKDLKCLSKDERREVWASVHDLLMSETDAHQPSAQTTEEPSPKKSKMSICLLGSPDSDTEEEEDAIDCCLNLYKAEPKIDIGECPLQWWLKREGAHARLAPIARKYLSTPATTVPCERLFSLSGHIIQKKRASLSSDNVNRIVCLSNWLSAKKD